MHSLLYGAKLIKCNNKCTCKIVLNPETLNRMENEQKRRGENGSQITLCFV